MSQLEISKQSLELIDDMLYERCLSIDPLFKYKDSLRRVKAVTFRDNPLVQNMFLDDYHYIMTIDCRLIR